MDNTPWLLNTFQQKSLLNLPLASKKTIIFVSRKLLIASGIGEPRWLKHMNKTVIFNMSSVLSNP